MAKKISLIELLGGNLLSKTAATGELLVKVNKKNIFLEQETNGFFRITILSDLECRWNWHTSCSCGRSEAGNYAFGRREISNTIKLVPCIETLVTAYATLSLEEFMSIIEQLGEKEIIAELEKIAVLHGNRN